MKYSILVTGATGYVGTNLVKHLVQNGHRVHAIVRPDSNTTRWGAQRSEVRCHHYDGTLNSLTVALQLADPLVVVHLASCFLSHHAAEDVDDLIASNVLFGTQLAEAMVTTGNQLLINTGTCWQHFQNQPYAPVNLYAATKQAYEAVLQFYVEARSLRVVTLKLFDSYGPHDWRRKLFSVFRQAEATVDAVAMSGGNQLIDLVYIDDIVNAYCTAISQLEAGLVESHSVYAVSSGRPLTLRQLAAEYEHALGVQLNIDWGRRPYREREVMKPWDRGTPLPNWTPRVSLSEGIRKAQCQQPMEVGA